MKDIAYILPALIPLISASIVRRGRLRALGLNDGVEVRLPLVARIASYILLGSLLLLPLGLLFLAALGVTEGKVLTAIVLAAIGLAFVGAMFSYIKSHLRVIRFDPQGVSENLPWRSTRIRWSDARVNAWARMTGVSIRDETAEIVVPREVDGIELVEEKIRGWVPGHHLSFAKGDGVPELFVPRPSNKSLERSRDG